MKNRFVRKKILGKSLKSSSLASKSATLDKYVLNIFINSKVFTGLEEAKPLLAMNTPEYSFLLGNENRLGETITYEHS